MICRNLRVGIFNAGSLGTKHEELVVAIQDLAPDIMAINETWLGSGQDDIAPKLAGYHLRHMPRSDGRRGGGVGFYIRRGLIVRTCQHPIAAGVEQMWLSLRVGGKDIAVGTAYRPPPQDVNIFLDAVTCSAISMAKYDSIILLGDFNIDLLTPSCFKYKLFTQFLHSVNLTQLVEEPTHFTDHSQSLIDVICTDAQATHVYVKHSPDLGGHAMVVAEFKFKKDRPSPRWLTYRPMKNIIVEQFEGDLNCVKWTDLCKLEDVDTLADAFASCVKMLFDLHAPIKKKKFLHPPHPWITDTIKDMMRIRDNYHKKAKINNSSAQKDSYKEMKHIVITAIENEKTCFFNKEINRNINNSKTLWKNLKDTVIPNKKSVLELPSYLNDPNNINVHFLNVPGENRVSISQLTYFEHHRLSAAAFSLQQVDEETVVKIIKGFKSNAQGDDGISLEMLQLTLPQSLSTITTLINKSLEQGIFPDNWKVAVVRPLPKTSQPETIQDLRPISLLSCVSKVLERVVCVQLTKYLEDHNILPHTQSGFRRGYGTATALADVVDNLLADQDQGMISAMVLLDFSRAFDSINTTLLLSKLSYYGVDAGAVKWFHSYLSNRRQYVELPGANGDKNQSSPLPVTRGVPQGSILGPILYILFSADITNSITHSRHHLYADDLQLYISFPPSEHATAEAKLNEDLARVAAWCESNCLTLNPKKSKLILFGSRYKLNSFNENCSDFTISLNVEIIERVEKVRNLGLIMDSSLNFESHVCECVRNCFYRLKLLYKIRPYLCEKLKIRLCESLVLSKLNYCDTVYGPCILARTKNLIQRVQNSCARFCFHVPPRSHVTPFLNSANLLKMEARRRLHLASLLFEAINTGKPRYLLDKLVWAAQERSRYPKRKCTFTICTPAHRTMAFRGSFRFAASRCWNDLPPPLRDLKTKYTFKKHLRNHLIKNQKC